MTVRTAVTWLAIASLAGVFSVGLGVAILTITGLYGIARNLHERDGEYA